MAGPDFFLMPSQLRVDLDEVGCLVLLLLVLASLLLLLEVLLLLLTSLLLLTEVLLLLLTSLIFLAGLPLFSLAFLFNLGLLSSSASLRTHWLPTLATPNHAAASEM